MLKKRVVLVLLCAFVCLFTVGCKDKVKTLKCTSKEDSGNMVVEIGQNKKTYELTNGSMSMEMDISAYGETAANLDWESMFCGENDPIYKECSAKVNDNTLTVKMELNMDEYQKQLKEDGDIKDLDKDTLNELKESAEKDGATCKIS